MNPLRVLYVINGLGTGGAERSLSEMLPGLVARGVQPRIVCLHPRREGVEAEVRRQGVPVDVFPGPLPARVRRLRRLIAEERPDLVHTAIFEANLTGGLAAARSGRPVLMSLVNTPYETARLQDPHIRPLGLRAARVVDAWMSHRLARHFHAITEAVKNAAVRTLRISPERITVVERGRSPLRLGAPGEERRRQVRWQLGIPAEDHVLITVGRQEYQKGHRYLLQALSLLLPARPRLRLLLAGRSGYATEELTRLHGAFGLKDRVWFLGHREDVPDLLAAADLFVFPSLWEGLGGAVIEAMALGLPVVASDIPALREVVAAGHNADLVPPGSPGELARAIGALLDDPGRAAVWGARGRQIFEMRFTLDRCTARMADLYAKVVAMAAAGSPNTSRGVPSHTD